MTNTQKQPFHVLDAYWRAANYLSVGQIFLWDNPLLKRALTLADVKPMLLGHWGTTPGQNFIYAHLNRIIKSNDLDMIYVSGPGHGGPALVGNTYLKAPTVRSTPTSAKTRVDSRSCSGNSRFRAVSPAMYRLSARDRYTKAASWVIR